jgi:uncharacterized membrane protein YbhN (UPF0104 family)
MFQLLKSLTLSLLNPATIAPRRRIVGMVIAVVLFVVAVEWLAGWSGVLAAARRLGPASALVLLSGLVASYLLRGARLYFYFHKELAGQFLPALRLTLIHNAIANLLPMRTGELSFPLLARQEFGLEPARTLTALIWFRLLDLLLLSGIATVVLATRFADTPALASAAWLPMLMLPALVLAVSRKRLVALAEKLPAKAENLLKQAAEGLPAHHGEALRDLAITAANWGTKLVALGAAFLLLVEATSWQTGVAAVAGEVSGILPVAAPAGLGTYEAVVVAAALPFGVSAAIALQAAVTLHLLILASSLAGFVVATWLPRNKSAQPENNTVADN